MIDLPREEGTSIPKWVLGAIADLSNASDIKVLMFLASRSRYRRSGFGPGELSDELGLDYRTTTASLRRLGDLGHTVSAEGVHALRGACAAVAQRLHKSTPTRQGKNAVQDGENEKRNSPKDLEGLRRTLEEENTPPTPQGNEAREGTAPAAPEHQQEISGEQEQTLSPDGEAAGAAVTDLPAPSQASPAPLEGAKNDATSTKKVPGGAARRASRALAAAEFDPLTLALPEGVPEGAWADWCGHRREIRKPLTERAARLTLNALSTAAAQGWDAGQLIAEAITHGWTGCVFEKHRSPAPQPTRGHIVKFPVRRPQTTEEANARFAQNMAANADAVRGVFDD